MSTSTETQERIIPQSGNYTASMFANGISVVIVSLAVLVILLFTFGFMSLLAGINQFRIAMDAGIFDVTLIESTFTVSGVETIEIIEEPVEWIKNEDNIRAANYMQFVRMGFAVIIMSFVLTYPLRWLSKTYGRQSIAIKDSGIEVYKWPRTKHVLPWEGVLDVTVKQSESVLSNFFKNAQKITIYTMDRSIGIESMTIANNKEAAAKLQIFGDSLEERVIDFGYGESLAVIWRRMKRNKIGMFGAFLVIFFIFFATVGAVIGIIFPLNSLNSQITEHIFIFYNPVYPNFNMINRPPSADHWFGTDAVGRDIFSRLLFGAFYSILIAVISTVISTFIGAFVGAASGYLGGTLDNLIQRLTEILNSLPGIPILLLISSSITLILQSVRIEGAYYLAVYSIFALIGWGGIARVVRSEVLGLKNSEFIQAEIVLGSTHGRIIKKHILPNAMSTVIIYFTLGVAGNIIGVASLSFLGFGSNSTLVWGKDLSDAINNRPLTHWWGVTFISLLLFLLVLGFNLLGDTLRDALDPTLKE
ncbi:MAG: ABC transporter permease [Candidatus Heimdallarchaeota archaeon]|nr:ABC transporter permease [Candidatus Heimdallarchaeota archaeon]